jgi:hypothetical protein
VANPTNRVDETGESRSADRVDEVRKRTANRVDEVRGSEPADRVDETERKM